MNSAHLASFTDILGDEIGDSQESQPLSLSPEDSQIDGHVGNIPESSNNVESSVTRPAKGTGQHGHFRSVDEIDIKYRSVFSYRFFNLVQSNVIEDALYSDKSMVVCAPTGSGKTVVFEMAIVQLLMEMEDTHYTDDFKIIYMAPVKALCTERLTEWYPKFTKLGLLCIEVTGDTDVDFSQLKPYRIIITTPEKWDMVTRRWREHRQLVEVIKLFLIDEVHILNDETRGPVLEAVVSRMKTIELSAQSAHRIEQLQNKYQGTEITNKVSAPKIRFVAISATVSNPEDVAAWLGTDEKPAVFYKFGDESRPVKLKRVVEGYPCPEGTSIFKFDIVLNYKLWPIIQKYHDGKPTLIFCNTRKSVTLTAETLSRELTVTFNPEQRAKLTALASTIKNKKLQALVLSGVGCHHAGLLFEERTNIEMAFRNRDLPILITTTTLAMGVNLPAHLVIIKNTQQYVNGGYQEYSISTILQMVGRAGRPQYDTEATAVIMTRICDKPRYQALVGGSEPLQSYLHKRLAENLNSEAALSTVNDVAQCVQWLRSTFLCVRAARDPKRYLGLNQSAPQHLISKKIEELCVKAMNGLATSGLITMDEASCIESTEAGRLMSIFYLDLETMKHIMKISGTETLERLLWLICESHELADMHLRVDERRCLNTLNRNNAAATIRFPMKGKISSRQMKLNCVIQAILGCLNIPDPSLNQEAMKIMRIADRVCKCLVAYVTRPALISLQPKFYSAVLNALILAKCVASHLWENSPFVSKQLKGIGPTFSTLLATAGKVNFMLLEESHPRDLERIMNKGPPAGNVLRKQISFLPKYQLTMSPIDEQSVNIQLVLLNHNYLSENIENLTAGAGHKSYIIVGDTENNLLLLTSFRDKELISVYNGTIAHQVSRRHSFEHKMFAHCISTGFVGIDALCEYLFKSLEPVLPSPVFTINTDSTIKPANKQTTITDTFKERKRKNTPEYDITQSKEKKKRGNAIIENFRFLKESFRKTSKELKKDLDKSAVMSHKILQELNQLEKPEKLSEIIVLNQNVNGNSNELSTDIHSNLSSMPDMNTEIIDSDEFVDDEKINDLLNKIESEISEGNLNSDLPHVDLSSTKNAQNVQSSVFIDPCFYKKIQRTNPDIDDYIINNNSKKHTQKKVKSNYNFIALLEKNIDLSDEEEPPPIKNSGFSETIKSQIEKYLEHTKLISKVPHKVVTELLQDYNTSKTVNENTDTSNLSTNMIISIPNTEARKDNFHSQLIDNEQNKLNKKCVTNGNEEVSISGAKMKYYHTIAINDINDTVVKTIASHDNKALGNNDTIDEKPVIDASVQNASSAGNSYNYDDMNNIKESSSVAQKSILYTDDSILTTKRDHITEQNHNDNTERNTKSYLFDEASTKSNTMEYSTAVDPLPHSQIQSLVFPEKPEAQIYCRQNNTMAAITDMKTSSHGNHSLDFHSGARPFSTSANYINNSDGNKAKKQNINIRKYSFSSTKTDIINKGIDVQVIRNTKIDLNITEIISLEGTGNREPQVIDTKDEEILKSKNMCIDFLPVTLKSHARNNEIQYAASVQNRNSDHNENVDTDLKCIHAGKNYTQSFSPQKILATTLPQRYQQFDNLEQIANTDHKSVHEEKKYDQMLTSGKIFIPPPPQFNQRCNQMIKVDIDTKCTLAPKKDIQTLISRKIFIPPIQSNKQSHQMDQNALVENNNTPAFTLQSIFTPTSELDGQCNNIEQTAYKTDSQAVNKSENDVRDGNLNRISTSPQQDCNRLENILKKYSKLLRKNNTGNLSQTISQTKAVDKDLSNSAPEKPKRPFKIADIHNLNTALPSNLINEISKPEHFSVIVTDSPNRENIVANSIGPKHTIHFQKAEPIREYQDYLNPIESSKDFIIESKNPNVGKGITANILEDFPENNSHFNTIEELEPKKTDVDFNIDQSMFNPKTLLQCLSNDEPDDIVPPPREFCDESYSEIHDELTLPRDCYDPMGWDQFNKINESIFQDESHIELTPTKEIETWTLSEKDESCESLASSSSFNRRRSFTIMHNSSSSQIQSPSVTTIRQNLGRFNFCRKKKLLPKT